MRIVFIRARFLIYFLLALNCLLCAADLLIRYYAFRSDRLMAGHKVDFADGITRKGVWYKSAFGSADCYLLRYASKNCRACIADRPVLLRLVSDLAAQNCRLIELSPGGDDFEDENGLTGIVQMAAPSPEFVWQSRFRFTPTTILLDRSRQILWSRVGSLSSRDEQEILQKLANGFLPLFFSSMEVHLEPDSNRLATESYKAKVSVLSTDRLMIPSDGPLLGDPSSAVRITEFADFECPFCRRATAPLDRLLKEHKNVSLLYKQFPLPFHPHSYAAAKAAIAAERQHRFWEMERLLYDRSNRLSDETITECARLAGLNLTQFNRDVHSASVNSELMRQIAEAKKLGVNATPTLFINGRKLNGGVDYLSLNRLVQAELNSAQEGVHRGVQR